MKKETNIRNGDSKVYAEISLTHLSIDFAKRIMTTTMLVSFVDEDGLPIKNHQEMFVFDNSKQVYSDGTAIEYTIETRETEKEELDIQAINAYLQDPDNSSKPIDLNSPLFKTKTKQVISERKIIEKEGLSVVGWYDYLMNFLFKDKQEAIVNFITDKCLQGHKEYKEHKEIDWICQLFS